MRTIFLLVFSLCVAACANGPRFTPTTEADPTEVGLESTVLVNELLRAYQRLDTGNDEKGAASTLCKMVLPSFQEKDKYSYRRYAKIDKDGNETIPFRCYGFVENAKPADISRHIGAGFALSDLYCDTFFRRISDHSNQRRFARSLTNDVGAAISAILGLAKATPQVTGGIGAAFGLADGTFRNYEDTFLVASDLPGLQNLVRAKQEEYREQTRAAHITSYADATIVILRYASYCSFTGMRGLINKSITTSSDPAASRAAMVEAIANFQATADSVKKRAAEIVAQQAADANNSSSADNATDEPANATGNTTESTKISDLPRAPQ